MSPVTRYLSSALALTFALTVLQSIPTSAVTSQRAVAPGASVGADVERRPVQHRRYAKGDEDKDKGNVPTSGTKGEGSDKGKGKGKGKGCPSPPCPKDD